MTHGWAQPVASSGGDDPSYLITLGLLSLGNKSTAVVDLRAPTCLVSLGMRGDALRGHLDMLVLAVLAEAPLHGYAVIEALRERSGDAFDLPEGTVYPVLHRLERAGLLASEWDENTARRRRTYRLTRAGSKTFEVERVAWEDFVAAVGRVVRGPRWKPA
jgi:PadR family transcriptional regulator PadR